MSEYDQLIKLLKDSGYHLKNKGHYFWVTLPEDGSTIGVGTQKSYPIKLWSAINGKSACQFIQDIEGSWDTPSGDRAVVNLKTAEQAFSLIRGHTDSVDTIPRMKRKAVPSSSDSTTTKTRSSNLEPERTIGDGKESVYVYTTKGDQALGHVKIGRTVNSAAHRIASQFGTSNSGDPIWPLLIRTDDSAALESRIHRILKKNNRQLHNRYGGTEWFTATPEQIVQIYDAFMEYEKKLGAVLDDVDG